MKPMRTLGGVVMVAVVGIVAAACSSAPPHVASLGASGGHTAVHSSRQLTPGQSGKDMSDFVRCLRSYGVNEPNPVSVPGHGLRIQIPTPGPSTRAGLAACSHFIAPIMRMKQAATPALTAAQLRALTRYATCMRRHRIAMLDPTREGQLNLGSVPGITGDFGRYSPQFQAADSACRHLLMPSARAHDNGTGP